MSHKIWNSILIGTEFMSFISGIQEPMLDFGGDSFPLPSQKCQPLGFLHMAGYLMFIYADIAALLFLT